MFKAYIRGHWQESLVSSYIPLFCMNLNLIRKSSTDISVSLQNFYLKFCWNKFHKSNKNNTNFNKSYINFSSYFMIKVWDVLILCWTHMAVIIDGACYIILWFQRLSIFDSFKLNEALRHFTLINFFIRNI